MNNNYKINSDEALCAKDHKKVFCSSLYTLVLQHQNPYLKKSKNKNPCIDGYVPGLVYRLTEQRMASGLTFYTKAVYLTHSLP